MTAEQLELLKYASIPVLAAIVGWATNWVAVKMTFYPLEFWGIARFNVGWQGIIPKKSRKMARISVDNVMSKLGTLQDVIEEIQPRLVVEHIVKTFTPHLETYIEEGMMAENAIVWDNLPQGVKSMLVRRVKNKFPELIDAMVQELSANADDFIDLRQMVIDHIGQDKALMNRIFLDCGQSEFKFIIKSGLYFGFLFGLVQMLCWWLFPSAWILPVFGLLVGLGTNWLALNFIFRPLKPVKLLGFTIQGLFLKRHREVSEIYTYITANEIVTTARIANHLLAEGGKSAIVKMLISKYMKRIVDESLGNYKFLVQGAIGMKEFSEIKEWTADKAIELSHLPFEDDGFNANRAKAVQSIMLERMLKLTPQEFQQMLRPAFQEDEWILVLAGGILGAIAGTVQLVYVFGYSVF